VFCFYWGILYPLWEPEFRWIFRAAPSRMEALDQPAPISAARAALKVGRLHSRVSANAFDGAKSRPQW
jgi:hypothetical protein